MRWIAGQGFGVENGVGVEGKKRLDSLTEFYEIIVFHWNRDKILKMFI